MVISVNQLSIHGAVADMISEFSVVNWMKWRFLHDLLSQKCKPTESDRETCCNNTSNDLRNVRRPEVIQTMLRSRFETVEIGQFFYALPSPRGEGNQSLCRECTMPRYQEGTRINGWIQSNVRFGPVSDIKVCTRFGRCSIEVQVQFNLCFKIKPYLGFEL